MTSVEQVPSDENQVTAIQDGENNNASEQAAEQASPAEQVTLEQASPAEQITSEHASPAEQITSEQAPGGQASAEQDQVSVMVASAKPTGQTLVEERDLGDEECVRVEMQVQELEIVNAEEE